MRCAMRSSWESRIVVGCKVAFTLMLLGASAMAYAEEAYYYIKLSDLLHPTGAKPFTPSVYPNGPTNVPLPRVWLNADKDGATGEAYVAFDHERWSTDAAIAICAPAGKAISGRIIP